MTAKEYLQQLQKLDTVINQRILEKDDLRTRLLPTQTCLEMCYYDIDLENHKNKTINPILGHKYSICPSGRSFKGY